MKTTNFLLVSVLAISLIAISCGQNQSPVSPQNDLFDTSNSAVLDGNVEITSSNISLANIQVGIQGTNVSVAPNSNGDFKINNLPLGNPVVEVFVKDVISALPLENVQAKEEIRMRLQVGSNCLAKLTQMERNKKTEGELTLQIQPKKWNLDWTESGDEVVARINGEGYDTIQEDTVEIYGPDGILYIPSSSLDIEVGGVYFKAKFSQSDAIGLIEDPLSGMPYEITVIGNYNNGESDVPFELTDTIVIVGKAPRDTEELSIQVNPQKWNTNWAKSSGTVMVKFWGDDYDLINPAAVLMVVPEDGDIPEDVGEIEPASWNLTDDQLIVKFSKKDALSLIPDPTPGDKYVLQILVLDSPGGSILHEFEFLVEIVGPKK